MSRLQDSRPDTAHDRIRSARPLSSRTRSYRGPESRSLNGLLRITAPLKVLVGRLNHGMSALAMTFGLVVGVAGPAARGAALADMNLQELMSESVFSVSKHETKLTDSPAAVAIVTEED